MRYAVKSIAIAALALAGCSLFPQPAEAGTVVVSWVNPTMNTDGSTIPTAQGQPEALQRWRVEYGSCSATNTLAVKAGEFVRDRAPAGLPITSATQNLPAGNTCVRVLVANTAGVESDASNTVSRVIPAAKPAPPTDVTVALQGS
jgi:hypothetical protein